MTIIIITALLVFTRSIQQQNVMGGHYLAAAITPYFIAIFEVLTILLVVESGWKTIPFVGTGGAIGVISAMYMHRRITQCKN